MKIEPFVKTSDIKASIDFYVNFMGFEIALPPDPKPGSFMSYYARLTIEGNSIHLSQHGGDGEFGCLIYLRVDDIEKRFEMVKSSGIHESYPKALSDRIIEQSWGMKEFGITDPDGNRFTYGQSISE